MQWSNINESKPKIGQFACAPIPHLENVISGVISWNEESDLFLITSISNDIYYIMDCWMPLPEIPVSQ